MNQQDKALSHRGMREDRIRIHLGFTRMLPPERRPGFKEELVCTDNLVIALAARHTLAKQKVVHLKGLGR